MTSNIEDFKKSLLKSLIDKTMRYEIEWKSFGYNSIMFPYKEESILSDFAEQYKLITEESMFATIKYYKKNKKIEEKELRFALIKCISEKEADKIVFSLICDKEASKKGYTSLIISDSSESFFEKLEELYQLAGFKMSSEIKIIEKWMSGDFEEDSKQFKKQEEENKIKKRENKNPD